MKMKIKYLYLDDKESSSLAKVLSGTNLDLEVEFRYAKPFGEQITLLSDPQLKIDGLILDFRLDEQENEGLRAEYRALSLAQEIRTRATEGQSSDHLNSGIREFPIVICSVEDNLKKSYNKDKTGHDLFERRYFKNEIVDDSNRIAGELVSIAKAYHKIKEIRAKYEDTSKIIIELLGLQDKDLHVLDNRIIHYFEAEELDLSYYNIPAHEYARFILRQIVLSSGSLIGEDILAARLGIDHYNSDQKEWSDLKRMISDDASYNGIFSDHWSLWWNTKVLDWWQNLEDSPKSLLRLNSSKRVEFLRSKLNFDGLIPASPIAPEYSSKFWTICEILRLPLDPINGYIISGKEPKPWLDRQYVSKKAMLDAKLNGKLPDLGFFVHPIDLQRFESDYEELIDKISTSE